MFVHPKKQDKKIIKKINKQKIGTLKNIRQRNE